MATFSFTPSFEATEISQPRVASFQAGDGYQHRIGFGLHRDAKQWQLVFENRSDSDRNDIIDFLEARGGVESFDWTPPFGDAGKYICSDWQTTLRSHNFNNIRATFQQVYEP